MDSLLSMQRIKNIQPRSSPFPRRQEIVATIREYKMVTFEFLSRRFRLVPPSTLHFDLKQLVKTGSVTKLGSTRGVVYTVKKQIQNSGDLGGGTTGQASVRDTHNNPR